MNYETAKALKDAGFHLVRIAQRDVQYYQHREVVTFATDRTYMLPTLEELIEACGDNFVRLKLNHLKSAKIWEVWGYGVDTDFHASSPTEAVARLWLAINKK